MLMPSQIITLTLFYSSSVSWCDYVMGVLSDLVGVFVDLGCLMTFFKGGKSGYLNEVGGVWRASLGHPGHSFWGLFNLCLNNVTRTDGGACGK